MAQLVPSVEQQKIIAEIGQGYNVVVDAVAGAGKTSLIIMAHQALPSLLDNTLTLCYNSRLECDTQKAVEAAGLNEPMAVFTFHRIAGRLSGEEVRDDDTFLHHLSHLGTSRLPFKAIFLDESQDMRGFYAALILNIIARCDHPIIVVLGDTNQNIMTFHTTYPTSPLYLTAAPTIYPSTREWRFCSLTVSQRITPPMADLINHCAQLYDTSKKIVSAKVGDGSVHYARVRLLRLNIFGHDLAPHVQMLVDKYGPGQVLLMAPSVKTNQCLTSVINTLSKRGVPFYLAGETEALRGDKIAESADKVLVTSLHGSKGLTRRGGVVIMDNYMWQKGRYTTGFPNVVYVALTRCSDELVLVQHNGKDTLPMQCLGHSYKAVERVLQVEPLNKAMAMAAPYEQPLAVAAAAHHPAAVWASLGNTLAISSLAEYMDELAGRQLTETVVKNTCVHPAVLEYVDLKHVTVTIKKGERTRQENVSRLYAEAVPMLVQLQVQGKASVLDAFTAPIHIVLRASAITPKLLNEHAGRVMTQRKYDEQLPLQYRMKAKYLYAAFQRRLAALPNPPTLTTPIPIKILPVPTDALFFANCALALSGSQAKLRALDQTYKDWVDGGYLTTLTQRLRRVLGTTLHMNLDLARFKEYVGHVFAIHLSRLLPALLPSAAAALPHPLLFYGYLDICTEEVQVILRHAQSFSLADLVTAAVWACTTTTRKTFLVNMLTNEARCIMVTDKEEFIHRLLALQIQRQGATELSLKELQTDLQTLLADYDVPMRKEGDDDSDSEEGEDEVHPPSPPTKRQCLIPMAGRRV
jgi:hypothetical protein